MELMEVGDPWGEEFNLFNEDGVEGTHNVLEERRRRVENLHGACRGGGGEGIGNE